MTCIIQGVTTVHVLTEVVDLCRPDTDLLEQCLIPHNLEPHLATHNLERRTQYQGDLN